MGYLYVFLALLCMIIPASAGVENVRCKGHICTVRSDPGGITGTYITKLQDMRDSGQRLKIDGPCNSACSFMTAYARNYGVNVCITPRATFGLHMGVFVRDLSSKIPAGSEMAIYPPAIKAWIAAKGGLPSNKSGKILTMKNSEARKFWPLC